MRSTTIGNDNAKLVRYAVDPQRGVVVELVREWDHMDARTSKTSVDAMSGTGPVINPLASSLTYSGTWYRAKPTNAVESDMRGVVVTETLVPSTSASSTWSHAVNCGESRTVSLTEDLMQSGLTTLLNSYTASSAGHYYMVDVSRQADGRFTARVTDRVSQTHSQTAFTSRTSAGVLETTERKFNQDDSAGWEAPVQGVAVSVDATKNEFCKYDKTQRSITSTERILAAHSAEEAAGYTEARSKTYNDREAPTSAPSGGTGVINAIRSEQAEDGTYTNDVTSRTSKSLTANTTYGSPLHDSSRTVVSSAAAAPTGAASTTGIVTSVSVSNNQDGTVDGVVESTSAKSFTSPAFISERTPNRVDSSTLFAGLTAPLDSDLSTSTFGSLSARIAEDLTYSGILTSTTYRIGSDWEPAVSLTASVTSWILRDNYGVTQKRAVVASRTAQQYSSWKACYEGMTDAETLGYNAIERPIKIAEGAYVGIVEKVTSFGAWADI